MRDKLQLDKLTTRSEISVISNIEKIFRQEVLQHMEDRREPVYKWTSLYKVHNNFLPKYLWNITNYVNLQSTLPKV